MDRNFHFWPARFALNPPTAVWLALLALVTGGARLLGVSSRPIHADEAEQAYRLGALLETGRVPTFAHDLHGPLLAFLAWPFARFCGADSYATLEVWMLRSSVVVTSLLAFLALWLLRRELGRALPWAALLLATAPALNYHARNFIHETALSSLSLLGLALACRLHAAPSTAKALALGAALGALGATKLTAALVFPALLVVLLYPLRVRLPWLLLSFGTALLVAATLYSSFGRDWSAALLPLQSIAPMLARSGGETPAALAHVKPWSYLLGLLFSSWENWLWVALATASLPAWRGRPLLIGLGLSFIVPLIAYSLLAYKTPWLILGPLSALLVLGAVGVTHVPRLKPVMLALTVLGLISQTVSALRWNGPNHDRSNPPQAYVPTSAGLAPAVEPLLALAREPGRRLLVVGVDYWPLPWYLRTAPKVGYFDPPATPVVQLRDVLLIDADAWPDYAPLGWRIRDVLPLRANRTLLALTRDD